MTQSTDHSTDRRSHQGGIVLVTGAGQGIGAGIALLIGILSFTVLLGSLDPIPDPHSPELETGAALPAAGYAQR
jgi:NAD(P)-dependent dehydrogenase (short-subunit alcohol dehydrogenase family)